MKEVNLSHASSPDRQGMEDGIDSLSRSLGNTVSKPVGEVVGVSTTQFLSQSHQLYVSPPLGSLVKCGVEVASYGVVGEVLTQSIDPGRHPVAVGENETTEEDVYKRNPQLSRLLSTEFRSATVGFRTAGKLRRYLSPHPPRIHSFVYVCDEKEVREFSESLDFLSVLLEVPFGSADDVVASFLRNASRSHEDTKAFLVIAGKELAILLSGQLQRLNRILKRLSL